MNRSSTIRARSISPDRIIVSIVFALLMVAFVGFKTGRAKPATQSQPTPTGTAYPAPVIIDPADSAEPVPDAYPAAPPTPIVFPTIGYPAGLEPSGADGTPFPNIGSQNTEPIVGNETDEERDAQTQPLLGTIFLWLGFGAAFALFITSVVAAIYYFDRKRAAGK